MLREYVVPVHCRCDNANRCARREGTLADYRLNSNFFDPRDRQVWHVPGFVAFSHVCHDP